VLDHDDIEVLVGLNGHPLVTNVPGREFGIGRVEHPVQRQEFA